MLLEDVTYTSMGKQGSQHGRPNHSAAVGAGLWEQISLCNTKRREGAEQSKALTSSWQLISKREEEGVGYAHPVSSLNLTS